MIIRKEEVTRDTEVIFEWNINDKIVIENWKPILWDKSNSRKEYIEQLKKAEPKKWTEDHLVWETEFKKNARTIWNK